MDNAVKNFLIWLTGKDYTYKPKPISIVNSCFPPPVWSYSFHKRKGITNFAEFYTSRGPNVIHRLMQRVCLGIYWARK